MSDIAKNGDAAEFEELLVKYEPLILSQVTRIIDRSPELGPEAEELHQEGRLALYNAKASYKCDGGVTFGLYAKICIRNRLLSYLRRSISRKRREEKAANAKFSERKLDASEELAYAYEGSERLRTFVKEELSTLERNVLLLYIEKKSYREMGAELKKDEKSIDNALSRAKSKIKKNFKIHP